MQVSRFWAREDETACQADRIPHRVFADSSTNTQPVQTCATLYIVVQYWFQCRPEAEDDCLHPNGAPAARACRADQKRHAQAGGADHVRNASGRRVPSVPRHRAQGAGTAEKGRTHRDPHGIGQLCGVQRRRYERSGRLGLRLAAFRSADHHGTAVHRIGRPTFGVGGGERVRTVLRNRAPQALPVDAGLVRGLVSARHPGAARGHRTNGRTRGRLHLENHETGRTAGGLRIYGRIRRQARPDRPSVGEDPGDGVPAVRTAQFQR